MNCIFCQKLALQQTYENHAHWRCNDCNTHYLRNEITQILYSYYFIADYKNRRYACKFFPHENLFEIRCYNGSLLMKFNFIPNLTPQNFDNKFPTMKVFA